MTPIQKIDKIHAILTKAFPSEQSSKSDFKIQLSYLDKEVTLDFDEVFLRSMPDDIIETVVEKFKLVNTVRDTDSKYLFVNEGGVTPYAGNRDL